MPGNNRSSANLSLCERIFLKLILLLIFPCTFCLKFSILELPILNSELPNNVTIYPTNENARLTLICESVGQPIQIVYNYQVSFYSYLADFIFYKLLSLFFCFDFYSWIIYEIFILQNVTNIYEERFLTRLPPINFGTLLITIIKL